MRLTFSPIARLTQPLTLSKFQTTYFQPQTPILIPRTFLPSQLPALTKWFLPHAQHPHAQLLNTPYLEQFNDTPVTIEHTSYSNHGNKQFQRGTLPFSLFLSWSQQFLSSCNPDPQSRLYIAQTPLSSLPPRLKADLPPPSLVLEAGRGDIYDSSLWLGVPPTSTPLHRDPNPNFFMQLTGRKKFRILERDLGERVLVGVRRKLGMMPCSRVRSEEMMAGREEEELERVIWGDRNEEESEEVEGSGWEAVLEGGDAVFVPTGWWHAVRGEGEGINTSVNWWFR